jgi:tetratricopeptide (TPR) repeat protein
MRVYCCYFCASSKQLEEALELDPRSPVLHYNMGQAREMIGEMEGAIAEYKLSLDNDIRYMDGAPATAIERCFRDAVCIHSLLLCACVCSAYHSLARAISVLGDAESAVNILQVRAIFQPCA